MSNWDSIFADSHFSSPSWSLPIGDNTATTNTTTIQFAPLQFVTDVDPVGYTYHRLVFPDITNQYTVPTLQEDDIDVEELLDAVREADLEDYYALLFVSHKGLDTTEDDIKKTWKIINVYLHPDKVDSSRKAEAEIRFKACQKAYETLSDPILRIDYDSSIEFDDAIPSDKLVFKTTDDFIKVYKPVFQRNARWSKIKNVPSLGDGNSTEEELNKFYKFWFGFSSWRTFPSADTEKVGSSASRDERRRAQQKNDTQRAAAKTKEITRIRTLTQRASDNDPRMKLFKQERIEKEKAAKQAAYDAKQKASGKTPVSPTPSTATTTAATKGTNNKGTNNTTTATKTTSQKTNVKPTEKVSKETSKTQPTILIGAGLAELTQEEKEQQFIDMVQTKVTGALTNDKYYILNVDKREQIPIIVDKLMGDRSYSTAKKLDDILMANGYVDLKGINGRRILEIEQVVFILDELEGREKTETKADAKIWTVQEEKALNDALIKIPTGTKERYAKVTVQVNLVNGTVKRTEKEVIRKVKEMELIRQLGVVQFNQLKAQAQVADSPATTTPEQSISKPQQPETKSTSEKSTTTTTTTTEKQKSTPTDVTSWTTDEQKLLEKGLQTAPKDDTRWNVIATIVGSKTAEQCQARFNYLREQIAAKKAAAAAAAQAGK